MRTHIEINVQTGERTERPYTKQEEAAADAMAATAVRPELSPEEKVARLGPTAGDVKAGPDL